MKLTHKMAVVAAFATMSSSAVITLNATPAHAAVWGCSSWVKSEDNTARASCSNGVGYYRVRATCTTGYWPYVKTIYGPWIYRNTNTGIPSPVSVAYGDPSFCGVATSAYEVR